MTSVQGYYGIHQKTQPDYYQELSDICRRGYLGNYVTHDDFKELLKQCTEKEVHHFFFSSIRNKNAETQLVKLMLSSEIVTCEMVIEALKIHQDLHAEVMNGSDRKLEAFTLRFKELWNESSKERQEEIKKYIELSIKNYVEINNDTLLMCAVKNEQGEIVQILLQQAMCSAKGATRGLDIAASLGYKEIVIMFLSEPRLQSFPFTYYDTVYNYGTVGSFAIANAATNGHLDILDLLLKDGRFNPDATFDYRLRLGTLPLGGVTTLVWAADQGKTEIVRKLVYDPRVNISYFNNLALICASHHDDQETIKVLLETGRLKSSQRSDLEAKTHLVISWTIRHSPLAKVQAMRHLASKEREKYSLHVHQVSFWNERIQRACQAGHLNVAKMLFRHAKSQGVTCSAEKDIKALKQKLKAQQSDLKDLIFT